MAIPTAHPTKLTESWMHNGECIAPGNRRYFRLYANTTDDAIAKTICSLCPVRGNCGDYILNRLTNKTDPPRVMAGLDQLQRARLRIESRQASPKQQTRNRR